MHHLLYATLILVPLSGWIGHAASEGFAPILWPLGQSLPLVPKSEAVHRTAFALHIVFERVLALSLLLHVAGALKHHFWDRDATLRRMAPGRPALPPIPPRRASLIPPAAAAAVVAGAVGVGAALGLYAPEARATETATEVPAPTRRPRPRTRARPGRSRRARSASRSRSSAAASRLLRRLERVRRLRRGARRRGAATAPSRWPWPWASLTLGSVTSQALGAEFFDAEGFPRAVFAADILAAPEGSEDSYVAEGTLSLRGVEVPVRCPST